MTQPVKADVASEGEHHPHKRLHRTLATVRECHRARRPRLGQLGYYGGIVDAMPRCSVRRPWFRSFVVETFAPKQRRPVTGVRPERNRRNAERSIGGLLPRKVESPAHRQASRRW
jgi:hypothetical protein